MQLRGNISKAKRVNNHLSLEGERNMCLIFLCNEAPATLSCLFHTWHSYFPIQSSIPPRRDHLTCVLLCVDHSWGTLRNQWRGKSSLSPWTPAAYSNIIITTALSSKASPQFLQLLPSRSDRWTGIWRAGGTQSGWGWMNPGCFFVEGTKLLQKRPVSEPHWWWPELREEDCSLERRRMKKCMMNTKTRWFTPVMITPEKKKKKPWVRN